MAVVRLPSPPRVYDTQWANQYTRVLEQENQQLWNAVQLLQQSILPLYTTTEKGLLTNRQGQLIFDTTLNKACINTGSGWETITSV